MAKRFLCLLLAVMCLCVLPARAGFVPHATLSQIADKSDVLVAGEVLEVRPVTATSGSSPTAPNMKATVRVLRAYPAETITSPTIEVEYRGFGPQWQKDTQGRLFTTDMFFTASPSLRVGQRVVLPLDKPAVEGEAWPFSIAEGTDLLVPVALRAPLSERSTSRLDFLQNELAGALCAGDAKELRAAVDYLFNVEFYSYGAAGKALPDAIYRRAAARIGDNEQRWLDIAVFSLQNISRTTPRSSIAQMRVATKGQRPNRYWPLLTQALQHLHAPSSTRFDQEKLIAALLKAKADVVLAENYSTNPQVLRYFGNGLAQGQSESLRRIMALFDNRARAVHSHPLIPAALSGARCVLYVEKTSDKTSWYEAVTLIRKYGNARDWQFYMSELRRAQHTDFKRFSGFYRPTLWSHDARAWPVFALMLDDKRQTRPNLDYRICDEAVFTLQTDYRVNLGWKNDLSLAQRNQAVAKAKAWLKAKRGNTSST